MNLPTQTTDVWTLATEQDKLTALASLANLPSRPALSAEWDEATFFVALEGVTRFGLAEAVKRILKGRHGHAFFPSAPEMRLQYEEVMRPFERERERILHRERMEREAAEFGPRSEPTPEEKARVAALYARFCADYEANRPGAEPWFPKLDPELVAQIPDNPKARERMGVYGPEGRVG